MKTIIAIILMIAAALYAAGDAVLFADALIAELEKDEKVL